MKNKNWSLLLFCLFCIVGESLLAQTGSSALDKFLKNKDLQHAAISFELKNISSGQIISSYNQHMSLTPASVNKIITTATALEKLEPSFQFQTLLYYDGYIKDSVLIGNLFIEGGGDPTLGSEFISKNKEAFLDEWIRAIRNKGIKKIAGDIIVLDQLFGYDGVSYKWLWEDLGNYYAPAILGISIFDNMYRLSLRSFKPGEQTQVLYSVPPMEDITFSNEIIAGTTNADKSSVSGIPFSGHRKLRGVIPPDRSDFSIKGDIPDPGLYLANYFKSYLDKNSISITGTATTYRLNPVQPKQKTVISKIFSPDLASIVRVINVRSNNHYAEHLYKFLTLKENIDIRKFWEERGLDTRALFLSDGSGLSPENAVSATFINLLLEYMYKKNGTSGTFFQSLPIAGKEGTVVSFLKDSVLEGKARVKSGSITNVCAYAGYIEYRNQKYVFSILINNFNGSRSQVRKAISNLLVALL